MSQLQVTGEAKVRDIQGPVVANSGVITALDGAASQYVRGDGTLADFPTSNGGGSSVSYYLNSSVSQGTIGGVAYRELSKEPIIGAGTDIAISANGYVASYITDANDPDVVIVPGGNFNCEFYFSVSNDTGNPTTYAELYKYDGTTFTLLGSSVGVPESINQGTVINPYYFAIPVATAPLALTDRLAIRIYVNVDGRTVTLHTENGHLCQVVTTFSKGMVSLNNLTDQSQYLTTGTSGTDFNIVSSGDTHTFNIPSASATNRGLITTGSQTIAGAKTFSSTANFNTGGVFNNWGISLYDGAGSTALSSSTLTGIYASKSGSITDIVISHYAPYDSILRFSNDVANFTYTFPDASGTIALTSDISYPVTSVFGRTGAVIAVSGDYNTSQVTELTNLYFTDARSRAALSFEAGSGAYNSTTGVITIPTNTNQLTNGASFITLTSLSGSTGITYNNTTGVITNSAPDQTVSLANGAGISVTGTYPSFTIASTITQYTDALARAALSFAAGSGAYNSTTGVITIPTNNNQITNGSNYITLASLSAGAGITYNNTTGVIASSITQYTDALARAAISLTTTGTSGAATYNSTTGVFNIPNYAPDLTGYVTLNTAQTITGKKTFSNAFGDGDPILVLTGTGSGMFQYATTTYNASLSAGQTIAHFIGRASSSRMSAYIGYQYAAADSNSNFLSLGHFNYDHLIKLYPTGQTIISGNLSASNFSGSSSGTNTGDQDLSGYLTTASASATYLPLSGGTLTGRLTINVSNNYGVLMNRPAITNYIGLMYQTAATNQWFVGMRENSTNNYIVYNEVLGTDAFTINRANNNATFGATISATNFSGSSSGTNTGDQTLAGLGGVGGTGTINTVPKFTAASTIASSNIYVNGNFVGINQSSPSTYALDIHAANSAFNLRLFQPLTATDTYNSMFITGNMTSVAAYFGIGGATTGNPSFRDVAVIGTQSAHDLVFNTSDTNQMRLFPNGNLLLGTGTTNAGFKLDVNGTGRFSGSSTLLTLSSSAGTKAVFATTRNFGVNRNFQIAVDEFAESAFTITPSTTLGGSGYTTPIFTLAAAGAATFLSSVTAGGNVNTSNSFVSNIINGYGLVLNRSAVTTYNGISLQTAGVAQWFVGMRENLSSNNYIIYNENGTDALTISKSNSNILINTSSAISGGGALQVNGNVNINGVFQINGTTIGGGGGSGVTGSGTINFIPKWSGGTSLSNSAMLEEAGGIQYFGGSSSGGNPTATPKFFRFNNDYSSGYTDASLKIYLFNEGGTRQGLTSGPVYDMQYHSSGSASGRHAFYVGNTEVIRFNQTTVLIGTQTDAGYKLDVNGTARVSGAATFSSSVTATSFFESSDSRLKIIVKDYEQPKGIENVPARMYLKNGKKELGYFAQDLQEILPSSVGEGTDGFLTLSYSQVHTAKIAYLEDKIAQLEQLIKTLL